MHKFFALIVILSNLNLAMSCGKVSWAIDGIYSKGPMKKFTKLELFSGLAKKGGPCKEMGNYKPTSNQKKLLKLLLDKQFVSYLKKYGKEIFFIHDCLVTQKKTPNYSKLISIYGNYGCSSKEILFVNSQNGGNLRSTPNVFNNKLTLLPNGAKLEVIKHLGEWIEVKVLRYNPYFTPPCKFKKPCKKGFIHNSLIQ